MSRLSLQLLGGFAFVLDGEPVHMLAYGKVRALLAYLVVQSDRLHRGESLAGLLWPGQCLDHFSRPGFHDYVWGRPVVKRPIEQSEWWACTREMRARAKRLLSELQ